MKIINCHSNPLDLSPATDAIIGKIQEIKAQDPEAQIVLFCGEEHTTTTHILLQIAILQRLKAQSFETIYAVENPHNIVQCFPQVYPQIFNSLELSYGQQKTIEEQDKNGEIASKIATIIAISRARSLAHEFCIDNKIKTVFNDVAKKDLTLPIQLIDSCDPLTNLFLSEQKDIPATSVRGFAVRNQFIIDRIFKNLENNKNTIILQQTGCAHILGMRAFLLFNYISGTNSLSNLFQSEAQRRKLNNVYAIKILPTVPKFTRRSIPWRSNKSNAFIIEGLSSQNELTHQDEHVHIQKIIEESGNFMYVHEASHKSLHKNISSIIDFYNRITPMHP